MATAVSPPLPITVFPPSLYLQEPSLHSQLFHTIHDTCGLTEADRLVLLGVLGHMPVLHLPTTAVLVNRILSLEKHHFKLLADLFTAGLLDARSWGGLRKGSKSHVGTPATTSTSASISTGEAFASEGYSELMQALDISSPFPLGGANKEPTPPTDTAKRSAKLSRDCLKRQNNSCPLTTRNDTVLETAHLIPHCVAALSRADTAFWLMLVICVGPDLRDHLYTLVQDKQSYTTMNGLVLDASMHRYFDTGHFVLLPIPDPTFDPTTKALLDVTFRWRSSSRSLNTCSTMLPADPESQVVKSAGGKYVQTLAPRLRQIEDGDVFRLFTDDPKRLPLPHPFLLSLHALLWRMIGSAGLAETNGNKRKRLTSSLPNHTHKTPLNDDDEGDGNDDGNDDAGAKRPKRGRGPRGPPRSRGGGSSRKGKGKETGPGDAPAPGPLVPAAETPKDATLPVPGSPSQQQSGTSAVPEHTVPGMTFLEKEYLAFRLRQLGPVPDAADSEGDSDEDSDEESNWSSDECVSPPTSVVSKTAVDVVSRAPTFLEIEFARFKGRQCARAVSVSVSGSESQSESDWESGSGDEYEYDSGEDEQEEEQHGEGMMERQGAAQVEVL